MSERPATELGPKDQPDVPPSASHASAPGQGTPWDGPTYYGRSQLKAAPFNNWVVGGYIFLGGLSGAAALLSAIAERARGREAEPTTRRGRFLSMLAPTLGAGLLVYDLHTPQRFYNMLRLAKPTSPMSIGTWILMSFSAFSTLGTMAAEASRWLPRFSWLRRTARATQVPAAVAGVGMTTYTAALLSATSTPLWAAAPQSMAVRFGSSSLAAGAAALAMGHTGRMGRTLDKVALLALAADLAATCVSHNTYRRTGVAPALEGDWGRVEKLGVTGMGTLLPMGLYAASLARGRSPALSTLAGIATLAGSAMLRVSIMAAGDESANRPEVSFRFTQPRNLPKRRSRWFLRPAKAREVPPPDRETGEEGAEGAVQDLAARRVVVDGSCVVSVEQDHLCARRHAWRGQPRTEQHHQAVFGDGGGVDAADTDCIDLRHELQDDA